MSKKLDDEREASLRANQDWAYKRVKEIEERVSELERLVRELQAVPRQEIHYHYYPSPNARQPDPAAPPGYNPTPWVPCSPVTWCQAPVDTTLGSNSSGDYIDLPAPPVSPH